MATVDSDKVVCGGIHAMIVAVLVLDVVKNGYKLPFSYVPQKVYLKNNKSARENKCFVKSEIKSLLKKSDL
jgi:hypothetical protein